MATVLTFANQKGGVAKTTSTFNVGAALAKRGNRVLMIDLDPQASLTIYAGLEPYEQEQTIVDVMKRQNMDARAAIVNIRENLDIITSRIELSAVENELLSRTARELILSRALAPIKALYDYIVIDCPPQLSTLTINALACTDKVIIPCKTDYLAYRGLKQLLETVETVRSYFKPDLEVSGLLATMFESRAKDDNEILELLREEYNVLGVIKRTTQAKKGMYDGLSAVEFAPKSELALEYEHIVDILV
jgi:chromosome partitioning protein